MPVVDVPPSTLKPSEVSFWLETSGDDLTPRPALDGSVDADVAILGAGYTGPVDRVLPAPPRPVAADRDRRARDRRVRGVRAERRVVRARPQHLDGPAREAPRPGGRGADAGRRPTTRSTRSAGRRAEAGIDAGFHKGGEIIVARGRTRACRRSRRATRSTSGSASATATGCSTPAGALPSGSASPAPCAALVPDDVGGRAPGAARARPGAAVERHGDADRRGDAGVDGFRPQDAIGGRAALVTDRGEVRAPGRSCSPARRTSRELPATPPPAHPAVVADRADGAAVGRPVGRDRLGEPRDAGVDPAVGRLPVADRGRSDPVRRARCAVPLRVADPARVRPPRPDPRDAARLRACVVPDARAMSRFTHAWGGPLGMPRDWHPTMAFDRATGDRDGARVRRSRRVDDEPRGADAGRPDHGPSSRTRRSCRWSTTARARGRSSRSAGSAFATRSGHSAGSTPRRTGRRSRRPARASPAGWPATSDPQEPDPRTTVAGPATRSARRRVNPARASGTGRPSAARSHPSRSARPPAGGPRDPSPRGAPGRPAAPRSPPPGRARTDPDRSARTTSPPARLERHEQPRLAVDDDLGDAADRARHDRRLARHRLEVDDPERLVDRRAAEHRRVRCRAAASIGLSTISAIQMMCGWVVRASSTAASISRRSPGCPARRRRARPAVSVGRCLIARTRWMIPFWRVIRPTNSTYGRSGSTPNRSSASVAVCGRYSSVSMPLWITWTFASSTENSRSTSSRVPLDTAMTASASSIAVRSTHADAS